MVVTIDVCTYTCKNGKNMLTTRYSNWERIEFPDEKDARLYCQGLLSGLRYKYATAAVRMNIVDGGTEEFY